MNNGEVNDNDCVKVYCHGNNIDGGFGDSRWRH